MAEGAAARRIRAAFYRGGTSKAVVFNDADLPPGRALRDRIFLHVLGSPDPYGRQLDGMGGGLSSLSKVVVVRPSEREDADVDYRFVQIAVDEALADYGSACGNMSSCVGPFAIEEGMVAVEAGRSRALVRIFDVNTRRVIHARFPLGDGKPVERGDFAIPGVAGTGARVALDFLDPGGAATGKLLPTGNPVDTLRIDGPPGDGAGIGAGVLEASLIDAANPVVFVRARDLGKTAVERPQDLDADAAFAALMEAVRRAGAVAMGMAASPDGVARATPKVAILGTAREFTALDGSVHAPDAHDLNVRLVSMGNVHRAVTLTGGMCTAVAARIPGTLPNALVGERMRAGARRGGEGGNGELLLGTPSGILPVAADVRDGPSGPRAVSAGAFRTQRRLMEGAVLIPSGFLEGTE